ncbi:MAG: hypothetical protein DRI33_03980 [Caldiserica bacterium]|nr:MAG: hypothetical protein DRI33_03980 [Caldisericota bacterium]
MNEEKVVMFNKKKTFTLGFGFLGVSVIWALYNAYVPIFLKQFGGYTGLFYFFSQAANIIAPPLSGLAIDTFGYPSLMFFAPFFFIIAFILMRFARRGEITTEELPAI